MPNTYASMHFHIVFSTKNRAPLITPSIKSRLHEYMGGTIRSLGGVPETIGGVKDHVHILVGLTPSHRISDFMRDFKKAVTNWVRDELRMREFSWQEGYSVFSVNASSRAAVIKYINTQEAHHKETSFRDELIGFLNRAGVTYDPRFLD